MDIFESTKKDVKFVQTVTKAASSTKAFCATLLLSSVLLSFLFNLPTLSPPGTWPLLFCDFAVESAGCRRLLVRLHWPPSLCLSDSRAHSFAKPVFVAVLTTTYS